MNQFLSALRCKFFAIAFDIKLNLRDYRQANKLISKFLGL